MTLEIKNRICDLYVRLITGTQFVPGFTQHFAYKQLSNGDVDVIKSVPILITTETRVYELIRDLKEVLDNTKSI